MDSVRKGEKRKSEKAEMRSRRGLMTEIICDESVSEEVNGWAGGWK